MCKIRRFTTKKGHTTKITPPKEQIKQAKIPKRNQEQKETFTCDRLSKSTFTQCEASVVPWTSLTNTWTRSHTTLGQK
jgi:hypothetical protein